MLSEGPEQTPFEEEELMKKWQEILGPSNEVVVSVFDKVNEGNESLLDL